MTIHDDHSIHGLKLTDDLPRPALPLHWRHACSQPQGARRRRDVREERRRAGHVPVEAAHRRAHVQRQRAAARFILK